MTNFATIKLSKISKLNGVQFYIIKLNRHIDYAIITDKEAWIAHLLSNCVTMVVSDMTVVTLNHDGER